MALLEAYPAVLIIIIIATKLRHYWRRIQTSPFDTSAVHPALMGYYLNRISNTSAVRGYVARLTTTAPALYVTV